MHNSEMRRQINAASEMESPWIPGAKSDLIHALSDFVDRTAEIAGALRKIHVEEQFGDCVEDGDPWPCSTIILLDGLDADEEPS